MAELDTGIGNSVASRALVDYTTTTALWPASYQVVSPTAGDTGTGSAMTGRNDIWDEAPRPVVISATGSSFTTSVGGPA